MQLELLKNTSKKSKIVNAASVPHRSLFRYPGGKTWFVPTFRKWISSLETKPKCLVEPFAGGGIVGLTAAFEDLAEKVLLVELDENISAVWEIILSKDNERLARKIEQYDLTEENVRSLLTKKTQSTYTRAFQTIIKNRVSHGGIMAPGSGLIKGGENGKGISSRWYPATLAKRIRAINEVKDKLEFVHGSGMDIIPKYMTSNKNCIFVDPPYTAGGKKAGRRLYLHHELDHEKLFSFFTSSKANFLFTYDLNEELVKLSKENGFATQGIAMKNTHHAKMTELIVSKDLSWMVDQ